ncbi:MAG: MATE family efflux transporter, partial [Chloroflexaceae bacterium]|nr:MATE family efflux transporter [Chloroflexaceae bacterium]
PTTVRLAGEYLGIMAWGFFPALGFILLRGTVAGLSATRPVLAIALGGVAFNIAGNYVFGFGKLGFPRLELSGLALASVLSLWAMFITLWVYIRQERSLRTYRLADRLYPPQPRLLAELLQIGGPLAMAILLEYGLFTVVTYLMGTLGTEVLAAHQIVLQITYLLFMVPLGMSFAAMARTGQWLGREDWEGARRAGFVSVALGASFMGLAGIVLLIQPQAAIALFLDLSNPDNSSVLQLALPMLIVGAGAQILDGIQKTAAGALYGLQDTRIPLLLSFVAFWGVGLSSGYWLGFGLDFGGTGLWLGQSLGVAIAAVMFLWRFSRLTARLGRGIGGF